MRGANPLTNPVRPAARAGDPWAEYLRILADHGPGEPRAGCRPVADVDGEIVGRASIRPARTHRHGRPGRAGCRHRARDQARYRTRSVAPRPPRGRQIQYLTGNPALAWISEYFEFSDTLAGGQ